MYHYLYKITCLITEKIYIGVHSTTNLDDGYMGSGRLIQRALKKHGVESFKKEILSFHPSADDAYMAESVIVDAEFCLREDTYNMGPGGSGGTMKTNRKSFSGPHTQEAKQKISVKMTGRTHSEETKLKISKNNFANRHPVMQRLHASQAGSYAKSGEHKKKISQALMGRMGRMGKDSPSYGIKRDKIKCPHCEKEGSKNTMVRWHFENCKNLKS